MTTPTSRGGPARPVPQIALATYSLRILPKTGKDRSYERLRDFADGSGDLLKYLVEFLNGLREPWHDADNRALHGVEDLQAEGDAVWGLLKSGEHGYTASLVDVKSLDEKYRRGTDDAEMIPFYFRVVVPPRSRVGLLMIAREGTRSAYGAFRAALSTRFHERWPGYAVEFGNHVPRQALEILRSGRVTKIQIRHYELPKDKIDAWRLGENISELADATLTIKAKRGRWLRQPGFLKRFTQDNAVGEVIVEDDGGEYEQMAVTLRKGGVQRTVRFSDPTKILPYLDISQDVEQGDDGHPVFESIHQYCVSLEPDLLYQLGVDR